MSDLPFRMPSVPEHGPPLPGAADLVVIGGGVIGVATALYARRRGLRVVLLEKGRVAAEQSSRNWGWIRQQGRDPAELPIMVEAARLWRDLARDCGEETGLRTCGLTYLARTEAEMTRFADWLPHGETAGLDTRLLARAEVDALLPGHAGGWIGALHTPSDMRAEPSLAVPALARLAVREGVVIREGCAARALDIAAGRVAGVVSEAGRIAAPSVVVAGGAWSSLFLRRHGIEIPQLSVRATVAATAPLPEVHGGGAVDDRLAFRRRADGGYTLAPAGFHELFVGPDAFRAVRRFFRAMVADPLGTRLLPAAPRGFPDAWTTARRWSADDETPFERMRVLDPAPNRAKVRRIARDFAAAFPALGPVEVARGWAGMIDVMPDVVPIVDAGPLEGLWINTGMCGHGFGIGPAFGRIMADLVSGVDPGHDLSRFRYARFHDGSPLVLGPNL